MKKIFILLILFCGTLMFAQSVNLYNPAGGAAYPDEMYFCAGEKFNLKVDAVATSTGDYEIKKDSPSAYPLSAGSTDIVFPASGSNKFSEAFPIGFTFSFYGKNYTKVVAGSNGRLVFTNDPQLENLKDINTYTDRTYSGIAGYNTYSNLPSSDYNKIYKLNSTLELNLAQIFFGYTDLIPKSQNGSVTYLYKNLTVSGQKVLLVSYQNQIRTDGTGGFSGSEKYSSTILLFDDGRIVIYVNGKILDTYNAILGIQNDDASKFKVPDHSNAIYSYNNGKWKSEGVAWLFKPNQDLTPKFKWFQNSTQLSETGDTLSNFVPNDGDILKVEVTYHDPAGAQVGAAVSDQITFKLLQTPQISAPGYTGGCGNPAELHVISPDPKLIYNWYSETDPSFHQAGTSVLVGNGSYYVQVQNTAGTCNLKSASETVSISSNLPPFVYENITVKICDNLGLSSQTFNLATVTGYPPGTDYSVEYFEAGNTTPITSANLNSGQTKSFTIRVSTNAGVAPACTFIKPFSISYLSFPANDTVYTSAKLCSDSSNYSAADFKNSFFAGTDYQFWFSTDGVNFNLTSVDPQITPSVWVKITSPDFTCQSTVKLNFDFHPEVEVRPYTQFPEHCFSSTEFFDLNITKTQLEYSSEIKVSFYRDPALTDEITDIHYRGSGKVYIKIENTVTGCKATTVPELNLIIYKPPTLIKTTPETKYSACGSTIFDLTTDISDYIGNWGHYSEIRYFDNSGSQLTQAEWENYDPNLHGQPYMIFVYNETNNLQCSNRIEFNLFSLVKPVALISQILICAETSYLLEDFKNAVVANPSQYTFTDEFGAALPANFDLSVLPRPVKFLLKNNTTGCVSDLQTVTFVKGTDSVLNTTQTDYILCDTDFDGKTEFNLDSKKSDFTNAAANFEYFKDALFNVKIDNFTKFVNETAFAQTIYVRITRPGNCPSSAQINLKVNIPTKSSVLLDKYFICYNETLTIDAGPENDNVQWSDGQSGRYAIFTEAGSYSVTLKNGPDGCPYNHHFIISDENQPKIDIINQTNNSIEVLAGGGVKPYRYYFNGVKQTSNTLLNPTEPYYEIQVESATGCLGPPKTIYFIKINNAFTPNGDGINDIWKIENLDKMESVSLIIVDRVGNKVFASENKTKMEWDGKSGGRPMPSSTYWYTLTWFDAVTQKTEQRQGWILLKNRN